MGKVRMLPPPREWQPVLLIAWRRGSPSRRIDQGLVKPRRSRNDGPMIPVLLRRCILALLCLLPCIASPARAEPALWRIKGEHATVWLFGTIHVLKPETQWQSPALKAAMADATALWLEIPESDPAVAATLMARYGRDTEHPLSGRLEAADREKLAQFLGGLGLPAQAFDQLRPWSAGIVIGLLPIQRAGYDPASGAEKVLTASMRAAGKPVLGFETLEQQLRYLADMPPDLEMAFFRTSLDEAPEAAGKLSELIQAWSAGNDTEVERQLNDEMRDKAPELYRRLIVERNHRFASAIATLVHGDKSVLVAIGDGHLVGADSVETDLAAMGIHAERVDANAKGAPAK